MNYSNALSFGKLVDYHGGIDQDNQEDALNHLKSQCKNGLTVIQIELPNLTAFRTANHVIRKWDIIWNYYMEQVCNS